MSSFTFLKTYLEVKKEERKRKRLDSERIDKDLPLDIEFGCVIEFDELPLLEHKQAGGFVKLENSKLTVERIGVIKDGGNTVYRYYLSDDKSVLQVPVDKTGAVWPDDIKLFQSYDDFVPSESSEMGDIDIWTYDPEVDEPDPEETYQIGYCEHTVVETDSVYSRVTEGSDQIEPDIFDEVVYLDKYGDQKETINHQGVDYGRYLNEDGEGSVCDDQLEWLYLVAMSHPDNGLWIERQLGMTLREDDFTIS